VLSEWVVAFFLLSGSFFMLMAAIGIVRFPDILLRMHAATKAPSFGALLMLTAVCFHFGALYVIWESLLVVVFIFLTSPVASHMIGRAAYLRDVPLWDKMKIDELKGKYDKQDDTLRGE
jgi:multicomponent Na+:H+ antiporter subunit G